MAAWRRMTVDDIPDLLRVADAVHPDLPESDYVFTERVQLFPDGCFMLSGRDKIYGYAISHLPSNACFLTLPAASSQQVLCRSTARGNSGSGSVSSHRRLMRF
ncbi:hypothetical protein B0H66DRAFT_566658 [Apodospora peruviana]|uniref:Uncharacterized protein n=1 Tax=Apodospora peruviana TaxID=516989 RepID=A0AAE0HVF4_9PEZI|nr:hypothetical protein B0H66DRAFT_566658 [Apodospora peruviana]